MEQQPEVARRAAGKRIPWDAAPPELKQAVEERVGGRTVASSDQPGGFSPGIASRLTFNDGARLFLKAVHPSGHSDSPDIHRREIEIMQALPPHVPAPKLLWSLDLGPQSWVVLALEDLHACQPALPWQGAQLQTIMHALARMGETLTPSPITTESASTWVRRECQGWSTIAELNSHPEIDMWTRANLTRLVCLEQAAVEAVHGESLVHMDIRGDNILVSGNEVWFVDWPHARVGAPWVDIIGMAPSVDLEGGPEPEELLKMYSLVAQAAPEDVTATVAAFAGFFTERAMRPEPPNLPGLRAFQAAQGAIARRWVRLRIEREEMR